MHQAVKTTKPSIALCDSQTLACVRSVYWQQVPGEGGAAILFPVCLMTALSDDERKPDKVKKQKEDVIVVNIYVQEQFASAAKDRAISSQTFNLFRFYKVHS